MLKHWYELPMHIYHALHPAAYLFCGCVEHISNVSRRPQPHLLSLSLHPVKVRTTSSQVCLMIFFSCLLHGVVAFHCKFTHLLRCFIIKHPATTRTHTHYFIRTVHIVNHAPINQRELLTPGIFEFRQVPIS